MVTSTVGKLKVNRVRDGVFHQVLLSPGTILDLEPTDSFELADGETLEVTCQGKTVTITQNLEPIPCFSNPLGIITYSGVVYVAQQDLAPPRLLYPRNTLLLKPLEKIIWLGNNATSYTITLTEVQSQAKHSVTLNASEISQNSMLLAGSLSSDNTLQATAVFSIPYPATFPALLPDLSYLITISDQDFHSEEMPGIGFALANDAIQQRILEEQKNLLEGVTLDASIQLIQAVHYATFPIEAPSYFRPIGDAWLALQTRLLLESQTGYRSAAMLYWYATILSELKLVREARASLHQALLTAQSLDDLSIQGYSYMGLWCLSGSISPNAQYFQGAITSFETLGDPRLIDRATQKPRSFCQP
ncbi:MAG: hypothetical protein R2880_08015 [Deinococcales bacterium]